MRPKLIAGNWKMHTTRSEATQLAASIAAQSPVHPGVSVALCPPYPYLDAVAHSLRGSSIALGAQNVYPEPAGAFTGEVSAAMLADLGCRFCIVGHSERRHVIGESESLIRRKLRAVLAAGLTPILCVGELLAERDRAETNDVVTAQVISGIAGLTAEQARGVVFAYEPVWAIGTGRNATPEQAQEVHSHIRKVLASRYNAGLAEQAVIQYGGSVKGANAESLLAQADVDGALVGGASLKTDEFLAIVDAGRRVTRS